jgi:hypothetical protein
VLRRGGDLKMAADCEMAIPGHAGHVGKNAQLEGCLVTPNGPSGSRRKNDIEHVSIGEP